MRHIKEKMLMIAFGLMLILPSNSWAQKEAGYNDYWGPHMMWGGGWMGGFSMIIFWLLVILAIYLGSKWAIRKGNSQDIVRGENALDVLKRRYASGEIDREQYLSMKEDLEK
ncbi:MAG: SHOCT domain-containing protein [Deltaproteobacteria bacterium]|nr:SHOCT domain-containing protein [Deltaproteobacteria bacterium]